LSLDSLVLARSVALGPRSALGSIVIDLFPTSKNMKNLKVIGLHNAGTVAVERSRSFWRRRRGEARED